MEGPKIIVQDQDCTKLEPVWKAHQALNSALVSEELLEVLKDLQDLESIAQNS